MVLGLNKVFHIYEIMEGLFYKAIGKITLMTILPEIITVGNMLWNLSLSEKLFKKKNFFLIVIFVTQIYTWNFVL